MAEKRFHLIGSVKPEEGINTFESVRNNRLAFKLQASSQPSRVMTEKSFLKMPLANV